MMIANTKKFRIDLYQKYTIEHDIKLIPIIKNHVQPRSLFTHITILRILGLFETVEIGKSNLDSWVILND